MKPRFYYPAPFTAGLKACTTHALLTTIGRPTFSFRCSATASADRQLTRSLSTIVALPLYGVYAVGPVPTTSTDSRSPSTRTTTK